MYANNASECPLMCVYLGYLLKAYFLGVKSGYHCQLERGLGYSHKTTILSRHDLMTTTTSTVNICDTFFVCFKAYCHIVGALVYPQKSLFYLRFLYMMWELLILHELEPSDKCLVCGRHSHPHPRIQQTNFVTL